MNTPARASNSTPGRRILPQKWDGKSVFDVPEVAEIFETSPWAIYEAIKKGELRAVRIGRLLKVPRPVLEEMLTA
jgi:excisionase family DNA binding protein